MTRSTVKRLTEPLDEPKIEFLRLRRAALRSHQNDSLAIAGRNLFDDEASSSNNTGPKPPTPPKTLHEHSHPTSSTDGATRDTSRLRFFHFSLKGKEAEWLDRIPPHPSHDMRSARDDNMKLDQFTQFRFRSLIEEEGWIRIEEYVQYQDDLWDEPSPSMNVSSISEAMQPTLKERLKRDCKQISFLETPTQEVGLKNPYLICDYCRGPHEPDECELNNPPKQVCLFGEDIYNDPSFLRFYQNDDTSPWGKNKRKEKGEDGPEWTIRSKFEDELVNFMLEKKFYTKGIRDVLVQHRKGLREQYSQILLAIDKSKTPEPEAPTLAITTRSGISTQDRPFPTPPRPLTNSFTEGETKKPDGTEKSSTQEPVPRPSILYQPSKTSNPPFPSRLKKQKKDDEDERLLSIFKQIHINLPFLEAMIHMPKGAKVLKDMLSHKEKLEKAASSVKLSEECSAIIQKSLPQNEGDPDSFTLPCLIGPLAVKDALADLGESSNLMPHSLF
ncbi:hypothetical protein Tco_1127563 [Tanacetum coccineum]